MNILLIIKAICHKILSLFVSEEQQIEQQIQPIIVEADSKVIQPIVEKAEEAKKEI